MYIVRKSSLVVLAAIAPNLLAAQTFQGAATLGYGHSSVSDGGGDVSAPTLDAFGVVDFDNGLFLGLDGKFANIDPDAISGDLSLFDLGSTLTYQFTSGATVGAYLDYADTDLNTGLGFDLSGDATSYGIAGGYVAEGFGFEAWVGETETSPDLDGVDWTDYGALFRYRASETAQFGAHYVRSELSGSGEKIDLSSFGIGGYYQFAQGWGTYAGISRQSLSDFDADTTTYGIGVDYDFRQTSEFPAQLSLELARTDLDVGGLSGDMDTVRVGLTFPLGKRTVATPLNSVARAAMAPRHNALTTLVDTAF